MQLKEIVLPAMGEGITDATIIRWLLKEGDHVIAEQPLVEIATDKVDSEVHAPAGGILKKILAPSGNISKVGETIAILATGEGDLEELEVELEQEFKQKAVANQPTTKPRVGIKRSPKEKKEYFAEKKAPHELPFISPFARLMISKLNIDLTDLLEKVNVQNNGILQKQHIEEYLNIRENFSTVTQVQEIKASSDKQDQENTPETIPDNVEVQEMGRMRRILAENLTISSKTIPHVTSFIETDVTNLVAWRDKVKNDFLKTYHTKLTLTPIIIEAIAASIKQFPEVNVSLKGNNIFLKKDINIGMATILPDRNLIVPVIRNADQLSLNGLAQAVNNLSERARNNELTSHEISGGTFTITNIGIFGTITGTPLVNPPESAILSVGAIVKKPMAILLNGTYTIGIRDIVVLSLSYDHRVIDGGLGGYFLKAVAEYLSKFDKNRNI